MGKKRGFTLIELMIVIAIIALLMAILVPAIERVRKSAKDVACRSNMHQWAICWKMFVDDNKGLFLPSLEWIKPLRPYYSRDPKVAICPRAPKPLKEGVSSQKGRKFHAFVTGPRPELGFPNGMVASYAHNQWLTLDFDGTRTRDLVWTTPYVKSAYKVPVMMDGTQGGLTPYHKDNPPTYDGEIYWGGTNVDEMRGYCIDRHNERVNGCFADWSARTIGLKELWELKWHRKWYYGKGSTPNYAPPVWPEWMVHMKDYARK